MKKTLRNVFAIAICVLLTVGMAACASNSNNSDKNKNTIPFASTTKIDSNKKTEPVSSTVAVTEIPTEQPSQQKGEVNTPGAVSQSAAVSPSYFDDAAFVGDSVSLMLSYYAPSDGGLGNAQFFTAGSLGCANALWEVSDESVHPSYRGEKMLIEDCIAKSGAKTVYIMLGMNDLGLYGLEATVENYETLVERILEKSPNVKIVIQSMTPMASTSTIIGESLNNDNIKKYNAELSSLCNRRGWSFVDVASVMYDEGGNNLNNDYCSDPEGLGVHFTDAGCQAWIAYLTTHTAK